VITFAVPFKDANYNVLPAADSRRDGDPSARHRKGRGQLHGHRGALGGTFDYTVIHNP